MFAYLSKKLEMSSGATVRCLSWSTINNYLACGCDNGLLKVLKIDPCKPSPSEENQGVGYLASPTNILVNQTLEGHSSPIQVIAWNNVHNKLTTSDARGLIVVWMLYKGSWYEEMVNNRNKSTVCGLSWSSDGEQICIVYEDGGVIVGSADGNRLWSKELKGPKLSGVNWSPDSSHLLFTMFSGEILVYDSDGEFVKKVEVETSGGSSDEEQSSIVALRWHHGAGRNVRGLAVVFRVNSIYLLRGFDDTDPLQVQSQLTASCAEWSPNGTFLAIGGSPLITTSATKIDEVKIFTTNGSHLYTLSMPVKDVVDLAWDSWNLRLAVGSGSNIFFVNLRPYYKVAYFGGHMYLYSYEKEDGTTQLAFWDQEKASLQEVPGKVLDLKGNSEMCAILSSIEDFYTVALVNTVGLALDSLTLDTIEPFTMAVTESVVVLVAPNAVVIWRIQRESSSGRADVASLGRREKTFHIDDFTTSLSSGIDDDHLLQPTIDAIICADAREHVFVVGRASGVLQLYSLPHGTLITVFSSNAVTANLPKRIFLNVDGSQVAMLDQAGGLSVCTVGLGNSPAAGTTKNYEKKDIWDLVWASDNPNLLCVMEKTRLYIISDGDIEEPVISSGYLMFFSDLRVTTILMDELMHSPENPKADLIVKYEARPLRDTRALLENETVLGGVFNYIEDNSYPVLWQMLARKAMFTLDLDMAETAFVRCRDYSGIQLTKQLLSSRDIDERILKARVCTHYMDFEEAEKLYRLAGRTDLLNEMWALLGRWKKVEIVQLIKSSTERLSEDTVESINIEMGDSFSDEGNWLAAKPFYEQGKNSAKIFECCLMLEDYMGLVSLSKTLPVDSIYHEKVGDVLAAVGLCDMAVSAYVEGAMYDEAVECAVQLSEWSLAMELAQKYKLASQGLVLVKFARHLVCQGELLDAIDKFKACKQPYYGARMAAMLAYHHMVAEKFDAVLVKKLFTMAATLMETGSEEVDSGIELDDIYEMLMPDEYVPSVEVVRWLDSNPWRGVEAIDLYIMLQRDLYCSLFDRSLVRGKKLLKYKDILGSERVGSLLALAAANAKAYDVTSEAFMLLETSDKSYEELSFKFFSDLEQYDLVQHSSVSHADLNSSELSDLDDNERGYDDADD